MSMPFEPSRAITFLIQVRKILEFQSTVDILQRMWYWRCEFVVFTPADSHQ